MPLALATEHPTRLRLCRAGRIEDYGIDNYGLVQAEENLRLPFAHLVPKLARTNSVTVGLIRGAKPIEVELPVSRERDFVIPFLNGTYPVYFVYGPLVFSVATEELAQNVGPFLTQFGIMSPLVSRRNDRAAFEGEQLVVVTAILQHRITAGYIAPSMRVLSEVNGVQVRSLRQLVETLRDVQGPFIEFEFAEKGVETLVFNRDELLNASEEILAENGIRNQWSDDLGEVWRGKKK